MPFQKSALYAIYFHIQENYHVMPQLLQSFFMCDFDVDVFMLQNEQAIRNIAVKNDMKNGSISSLYSEVLHMLHLVKSKLMIDSKFPQYLLVDIMRPYLYLYLMFMYSIQGSEQRSIYYLIMKKKIGDFFLFNSQFGRKRVDSDRIVKFNCNYPNFTMQHINDILQKKNYMHWYSYWNTMEIPNPYASQLARLNGYSPSMYRTDVDYDDDYDDNHENTSGEEDGDEQHIVSTNTASNATASLVADTPSDANDFTAEDDEDTDSDTYSDTDTDTDSDTEEP
jgi:hypothetical protein